MLGSRDPKKVMGKTMMMMVMMTTTTASIHEVLLYTALYQVLPRFILIFTFIQKVVIIIPFNEEKPRIRKIKQFAQDHAAVMWWSSMVGFHPPSDLIRGDLCPQPLSHIASLDNSFFVPYGTLNLVVE